VVVLLLLVTSVYDGAHSLHDFKQTLATPGMLVFNSVVLLFALLHTATWFLAVPKALPLRRGENRVPAQLLIGAHYGLMAVLSALILILAVI
jgi:fumarate reductase subunit C